MSVPLESFILSVFLFVSGTKDGGLDHALAFAVDR